MYQLVTDLPFFINPRCYLFSIDCWILRAPIGCFARHIFVNVQNVQQFVSLCQDWIWRLNKNKLKLQLLEFWSVVLERSHTSFWGIFSWLFWILIIIVFCFFFHSCLFWKLLVISSIKEKCKSKISLNLT